MFISHIRLLVHILSLLECFKNANTFVKFSLWNWSQTRFVLCARVCHPLIWSKTRSGACNPIWRAMCASVGHYVMVKACLTEPFILWLILCHLIYDKRISQNISTWYLTGSHQSWKITQNAGWCLHTHWVALGKCTPKIIKKSVMKPQTCLSSGRKIRHLESCFLDLHQSRPKAATSQEQAWASDLHWSRS